MTKQRNGLLEIYRFLICFWPLFYHDFFFFERSYEVFTVATLAVDFFFMISGYFFLKMARRLKDTTVLSGIGRIISSRARTLGFSLAFLSIFTVVCTLLFIKENRLQALFEMVKYWWFILYLLVATILFYVVYRLVKKEWLFLSILALVVCSAIALHYIFGYLYYDPTPLFFTRTFGCIAFGVLVSVVPPLKPKHPFALLPAVAILLASLIVLAYNDKSYFDCLFIILLFSLLVYISTAIPIGGRAFDMIGRLSVKMYVYMAFITPLYLLGLTNHRVLFIIDVAVASLDLMIETYRENYKKAKKELESSRESEEKALEKAS